MRYTQSFRFKMILLIVIPLIFIAVIFISASLISSNTLLEENRVVVAESTREAILSQLEYWRVSTLNSARLVANDPSDAMLNAIADRNPDAIIAQAETAFLYTECSGMTFADMEGNALARVTNPGRFGDNIKSSLAIADALEGKSVSYAYPTTNNGFSITAGVPIFNGETQVAVLFLSKRLDYVDTLESLKASIGWDIVLYDKDMPIASTLDELVFSLDALNDTEMAVLNEGKTLNHSELWNEVMTTQVLIPITGREDTIVGAIRAVSFHQKSNWVYVMWAIIFVICLLVLYPIIIINTARFVKPIRALSSGALQLSSGDVSAQIDHDRADEIGLLQQSMQTLSETMRDQAKTISQIAAGDLSMQHTPRSLDDIVGNNLCLMLEKTNDTFSEIRVSASQVSLVSQQVAQGAQQLALGANDQAATVERFNDLLLDVQAIINRSADVSTSANEETMEAGALMNKSTQSMRQLLQAMQAIDEGSKNITKIIKVIDELAFQTNILALNAEVEAAKAGQYGRGFSVVAGEVRNLAVKSAEAAKETADLIEGSSGKIVEGQGITKTTYENLRAAADIVISSADKISEIFALCHQQKDAIDEINTGIGELTGVIHINAETAVQSAASAEEMSSQAALLQEMVARFRLRQERDEALMKEHEEKCANGEA